MKRFKFISCLSLVVLVVIGLVVGCDKSSDTPTTPSVTSEPMGNADTLAKVQEMESKAQKFEEAVQLMEQYIRVDGNGLFVLEMPQNAKLGIDAVLFEQLTQNLEETNRQIQSGVLLREDVKFGLEDNLITNDSLSAKSCKGKSGWEKHWWGWYIYINDCTTHDILFILKTKATINAIKAGLVAALCPPAAVAGAIAAAAEGLKIVGYDTIAYICERGGHDGLKIKIPWIWISSQ